MSSHLSPSRADEPQTEHRATSRTWLPTTRTGALVAAGAVWLALGAMWSPFIWLSVLWWAGLVASVVADAGTLRQGDSVTARRAVENTISLGVANRVPVILRNRSSRAFEGLVRDEPPLDFVSDRRRMPTELPAHGECTQIYHVTPRRRGAFQFGALNLRLTTRLGLVVRQLRYDASQEVKVYPSLAGIQSHEVAARKHRLHDIGVHASRLRGRGLEFESLRAYVPGDELRRVDWKATARHAEPIAREYDIERSQHIILSLDLGRTMSSQLGIMTKADHAVNAAAMLAYVAAKAGDWVGAYAFVDGPVIFVPPRKHQFSRVLDSLYGLQPRHMESNYYRSFVEAARLIRKRSLLVLFTDLPDPDSSARLIKYVTLLTRHHLVLCAALSDYELYEIATHPPAEPRELYERTVAAALLADRQRALTALRQHGAIAFDATPANLSLEVVNRYLEIKARARL